MLPELTEIGDLGRHPHRHRSCAHSQGAGQQKMPAIQGSPRRGRPPTVVEFFDDCGVPNVGEISRWTGHISVLTGSRCVPHVMRVVRRIVHLE